MAEDNTFSDISQEEMINRDKSLILTPNKVDSGKVDRDENARQIASKVDNRFVVDYTFIGTGNENIDNPLGRIPNGVFVVAASKTMDIAIDHTLFTVKRITASSSQAGNIVKLLFF